MKTSSGDTTSRTARRIAVISGKGGVGKTVITANLAGSLSSLGRRILVVDADLGLANMDILLDVDPPYTLGDVLSGKRSPDEILTPTAKGFDLLPAGSGMPEGTVYSPALKTKLESILAPLETRYDFILFDAGAGVGDVVMLFATLAHTIILVATPEPTSLMDAYATIKILNQTYHRSEFLLVVNQTPAHRTEETGTAVARHLQNVVSRFLNSSSEVRLELLGSLPEDPAISDSIRHRRLLLETDPQAPVARLIQRLAAALDGRTVPVN